MKPRTTCLLLLIGCLLIPAGYALTAKAAAQDDEVKSAATWEHLAMTHDGTSMTRELSQQIVRLGNEGWQLVCVTPVNRKGTTVQSIYFFKRPK